MRVCDRVNTFASVVARNRGRRRGAAEHPFDVFTEDVPFAEDMQSEEEEDS